MRKRIMAGLLAVMLLLSLSVSAFAVDMTNSEARRARLEKWFASQGQEMPRTGDEVDADDEIILDASVDTGDAVRIDGEPVGDETEEKRDSQAQSRSPLDGELVLLHTGDTNGRDLSGVYTTAAVAQLKQDCLSAGAETLLLSAGGFSQGTPLVDLQNGKNGFDFLKLAGYDAATLGRHEFDYGLAALQQQVSESGVTVLAANLVRGDSGETVFPAAAILETASGRKVGVFGLVTPQAQEAVAADGVTILSGKALVQCANAQVTALRAAGCDTIVTLSSLGTSSEAIGSRSTDVLEQVDYINVMIDSGSGDAYAEGMRCNETLLAAAGENLKYIGIVLSLQPKAMLLSAQLSNSIKANGETVETAVPNYSGSNKSVMAALQAAEAAVEQTMEQPFATVNAALPGQPGVRAAETALGDLAADAVRWRAAFYADKVDAALLDAAAFTGSLHMGQISRNAVRESINTEQEIVLVQMTGAQLQSVLEAAYCMAPIETDAFLQLSGIRLQVDHAAVYRHSITPETLSGEALAGSRVFDIRIDGRPLQNGKIYTVAMTDTVTAGNGVFGMLIGKKTVRTGISPADALISYITETLGGQIPAAAADGDGRIRLAMTSQQALQQSLLEQERQAVPAAEADDRSALLEQEKETAAETPAVPGRPYTVQAAESLWDIAVKAYGNGEKWVDILNANRESIGADNLLELDMVIELPDITE